MSESMTSPRILNASERQAQAIELRKAGVTFRAIADACGYKSVAGAYTAVQSGIRKVLREPVEELVTLELARLDEMTLALWPGVKRSDVKAIEKMLAVMERRARLLGLDAPKRTEITGHDGTAIVVKWASDADA